MADIQQICYNSPMRLMLLLLVAAYPALCLLPSVQARASLLSEGDRAAARMVLHQIAYVSLRGTTADCETLSPLPLYAGAPSADDWTTFCRGIVHHDATACVRIPAMLTPDLRGFCAASFDHSLTLL